MKGQEKLIAEIEILYINNNISVDVYNLLIANVKLTIKEAKEEAKEKIMDAMDNEYDRCDYSEERGGMETVMKAAKEVEL